MRTKAILFYNGTIRTMTSPDEAYSCMLVRNGRISLLSDRVPEGDYDEKIDLKGAFVYPTLCDSHVHLLYSLVLSASAFNICSFSAGGITPNSLAGVEKCIREYASAHPKQKLIVVNQYIPSAVREGRLPTAAQLDQWTGGREIAVFSMDGHSCALSSAIMKKLGIQNADGIFSGAEYDMNQGKITGLIASGVTLKTLAEGLSGFTAQCFGYGVTKICALDGEDIGKYDLMLALVSFLAQRMELQVRLWPEYMNYNILKKYSGKMSFRRIGGCSKWEQDGSVGSHSAAFRHPYKDTGLQTQPYYTQEQLNGKIREGLEKGITMTCHAIGTVAIDRVIEAYRASEELIPTDGPMNRIDHFEFPSPEALDYVEHHRLAVTVQPGYAAVDRQYIKSYEKHLCDRDLELIVPLRRLSEAGVNLLGSSDSPVQSVNPFEQMRGMMDYYLPEQSLTAYQALKTYTVNPARALNEEGGSLKPNAPADFFITDKDIIKLSKEDISTVRAKTVYIGGKPVHAPSSTVASIIKMLLKTPKKI